jgi:phage FluMu protein Com
MRISRNLEEASPAAAHACEDVRCGCGSLLARVVDGAVELKCRRCKHVWRLPVDGAPRSLARVEHLDER